MSVRAPPMHTSMMMNLKKYKTLLPECEKCGMVGTKTTFGSAVVEAAAFERQSVYPGFFNLKRKV